MELRHLRYFRAVAEERHFGRAATRLHMAQPPLSQQVRQLEDELGVQLLRRSTRRVDLTPAGEAYLARVRAILDAVDAAGEEAQRIGSGLEGRLVVGCVGSATYSLLPALARALRVELPGIDFALPRRDALARPGRRPAGRLDRPGAAATARRRRASRRPGVARAAPRAVRRGAAGGPPPGRPHPGAGGRPARRGPGGARRSGPLGHARRRGRAVPRRRLRADGPARGGRDLDAGDLRGGRAGGRGRPGAGGRAGRGRGDVPPARQPGPDGPAGGRPAPTTTRRRWRARWGCCAPRSPADRARRARSAGRGVRPGGAGGSSPTPSARPRRRVRPRW